MSIISTHHNAMLYLLNLLATCDGHENRLETEFKLEIALRYFGGSLSDAAEAIEWVCTLWRSHDTNQLFEEACEQLGKSIYYEHDLALLYDMIEVDEALSAAEGDTFEKIKNRVEKRNT